MLESVQKALKHLHGSFINHNNEIILIPKFIVPPCKIGDTVYYVSGGRIERLEIRNINYSFRDREYYVYLENSSGKALNINYYQLIGYKLFHTLEEAEQALKEKRVRSSAAVE